MANGTNSTTQSKSAIQSAVEMSIAQRLPVLSRPPAASCGPGTSSRASAGLPEELRCRHSCANPFELFDGHAVEASLAAGFLDGPDDHSPDERRDVLHARG